MCGTRGARESSVAIKLLSVFCIEIPALPSCAMLVWLHNQTQQVLAKYMY